jgi:FixJ family two-component response regulator
MSASTEISHNDVLNAGAFDFVEKPISLNSLIAKIELAFATGAPNRVRQSTAAEAPHFIG